MATTDDISLARGWHHDWITALGLSIGAAVALGFSRFAYALLLPPMRDALGLSYFDAGALNSANAVGYLFGAICTTLPICRNRPSIFFLSGLTVSAVALLLLAATSNFTMLLLLRTVGGAATAFTFILGAALAGMIETTGKPARSGILVGLYVAGASLGIVLSGIAVPVALMDVHQGWRNGWITLGVIALLGILPAYHATQRVVIKHTGAPTKLSIKEMIRLTPTFLGYGLFGAGYVGYMTFIIAFLNAHEGDNGWAIAFWIILGSISAISNLLWGSVLGQMPQGFGPASVFMLSMVGTLPALIWLGPTSTLLSAVIFGGSFLAGPAAITILAKKQLPSSALTAGVALLTTAFAFGQAIGPLLSGMVTDITGNLAAGIWVSPVLLGLAAVINLLQKSAPAEEQAPH